MIWGKKAEVVAKDINKADHKYLYFGHPSPLGLGSKFEDCDHFSKANEHLESKGLKPIDWQI